MPTMHGIGTAAHQYSMGTADSCHSCAWMISGCRPDTRRYSRHALQLRFSGVTQSCSELQTLEVLSSTNTVQYNPAATSHRENAR